MLYEIHTFHSTLCTTFIFHYMLCEIYISPWPSHVVRNLFITLNVAQNIYVPLHLEQNLSTVFPRMLCKISILLRYHLHVAGCDLVNDN